MNIINLQNDQFWDELKTIEDMPYEILWIKYFCFIHLHKFKNGIFYSHVLRNFCSAKQVLIKCVKGISPKNSCYTARYEHPITETRTIYSCY